MNSRRKSAVVRRQEEEVQASKDAAAEKERQRLAEIEAANRSSSSSSSSDDGGNIDKSSVNRADVPVEASALKPGRNEEELQKLSTALDTTGLRKRKIGEFGADIAEMMFGFGDSWPPNTDAVRCIDSLVTDFVHDMGARALRVAELRPDKRLDKECFLYLVRKDRKKFQRVHRLLNANDEIKRVKKVDIRAEV